MLVIMYIYNVVVRPIKLDEDDESLIEELLIEELLIEESLDKVLLNFFVN